VFTLGPRLLGGAFVDGMAWLLRRRFAQRALVALVSGRHYSEAELDVFFTPLQHNPGVRRDLTRFLRQLSNRQTLEAARSFPRFTHPVLLVWGTSDLFFTQRLARRLLAAFPNARLELLARSRAFVPEDRPDALAPLIAQFVGPRAELLHA
jgi:pimeloyl-ACP methyl ester carboxylesterase